MGKQKETRVVDLIINARQADVSIKEVNKSVRQLTREFNSLKKSQDPQHYNKVKSELIALKKVQREYRKEINQTTSENKKFLSSFKSIAAGFTVGSLITNGISKAREFAKETRELSEQARTVKLAYNALNEPGLLAQLRKATKGAVDDLTLMRQAVQANNFGIPLKNLGKMFEFASKRARDTGESVDYLTNSIVLGISRKSIKIIDNLGISATELQEEMKETGDFSEAVGNIMAKSMEKAGSAMDETANSSEELHATWTNFEVFMGGRLNPTIRGIETGLTSLVKWLQRNFDSIVGFTKVLVIGTVAWVTYKIAILLATKAKKRYILELIRSTKFMKLQKIAILASGMAYNVLTGNLKRAKVQWRLLSIVMKATPWGLIAAGVVAVVTAFILFSKNIDVATRVMNKATEATVKERTEIKRLRGVIDSETTARNQKIEAIQKLRKIMPDYLQGITDEEVLTGKASLAIDKYIQKIHQKAVAEKFAEEAATVAVKLAKENNKSLTTYGMSNLIATVHINKIISNRKKYKKELDALLKMQTEAEKILLDSSKTDPGIAQKASLDALLKSHEDQIIIIQDKFIARKSTQKRHNDDLLKEDLRFYTLKLELLKLHGASTTDVEQKMREIGIKMRQNEISISKKSSADAKKTQRDKERADKKEVADAEKLLKMLEKERSDSYEKEILDNQNLHEAKRTAAKNALLEGELTNAEYADNIKEIDFSLLVARIEIAKKYGMSIADLESKMAEDAIKAANDAIEQDEQNLEIKYQTELIKHKDNDRKKLELTKDYLRKKLELELLALGLSSEQETLLRAQLAAKLDAMDQSFHDKSITRWNDKIQRAGSFANEGISLVRSSLDKQSQIEENNHVRYIKSQDKKRDKLQERLDSDAISKEDYDAEIKKLDDQQDARESALKTKQFKRQKRADVMQSLINTALSVSRALAQPPGPPLTIPLGILAGTLGLAQTSVISSTPVPQFYGGGLTGRVPVRGASDRKIHQAVFGGSVSSGAVVKTPTLGLFGEKGPELVIPNNIYSAPQYADIMSMLEGVIGSRPQFASGGSTTSTADVGGRENSEMNMMLYHAITELNTTLSNGINTKFVDYDYQKYKDLKEKATEFSHF